MASQDDIATVMSLTSINAEDATLLLNNNNQNVEKAINEYFEDSSCIQRYRQKQADVSKWNDDYFASDRDGSDIPSFKIHGPDVGPTRPNSRLGNRSPNHGGSNDGASANPNGNWNFQQNEDPDMTQALKNSLMDAGIGGQESGVLQVTSGGFDFTPAPGDDSGVQFGPANRNEADYASGSWALVPRASSPDKGTIRTAEVYNDPEPAERRRMEGAPAFLRPSADGSRIGALLTIFQEIPLLRELLLRRDHTASDYGFDYEWWSNGKIEVPKLVVASDPDGDEMEDVSQNHDLTEELQRITAFLDKTERSYGSVENIIRMLKEKDPETLSPDYISAFFEAWQETWSEEARDSLLSVAFQPLVAPRAAEFMYLGLGVQKAEDSTTLYDCLDTALWSAPWPEAGLEPEQTPYLGRVGEVLCFRLEFKSQEKKIDIPAVWYPDQFLASYRESAFRMKKQKHEIKQKITKMDEIRDKLTTFTKNRVSYKVRDLINASLTHDNHQHPSTEDQITEVDTKMDEVSPARQAALEHLSEQLRRTMASIDAKLASLEEEREKACASLQELSASAAQSVQKEHKYTLRGISTSSTTTYVNRIEFSENTTDESDTNFPKEQWWRIIFNERDPYPFSVCAVSETDVIEAARESVEPIVIYASEKAMQPNLAPLPEKLAEFVEKDNQAFRVELPGPSMDEDSHFDSSYVPQSPPKRKYNGDGEEAEDGYRASPGRRGSMDVNYEDDDTGNWSDTPRRGSVSPPVPGPPAKEMVERSKQPLTMLGTPPASEKPANSMDLDEIVEDEEKAQESAAVKELGGGSS